MYKLSDDNKEKGNFVYKTTGVREIENLMSVKILKMILKEEFPKTIKKEDRGRIDGLKMSEEDYKSVGLGEFLRDLKIGFEETNKKKSGASNTEGIVKSSETLSDHFKKAFARHVEERINESKITWDMIAKNTHAKELIENLYKFIEKSNEGFI